jgi:hypothetical protein
MNELQIFEPGQIDSMSTDQVLTLALSIIQNLLVRQHAQILELKKEQMETAQRLRNIEEKQAHPNRIVNKYVNQGEFGACYNPPVTSQGIKKLWKMLGLWNHSAGYDQPYARFMKNKEPVFNQFEWHVNGDSRYQWRIHDERGTELIDKLLQERCLLNEWHSHITVEERNKWITEQYGRKQ